MSQSGQSDQPPRDETTILDHVGLLTERLQITTADGDECDVFGFYKIPPPPALTESELFLWKAFVQAAEALNNQKDYKRLNREKDREIEQLRKENEALEQQLYIEKARDPVGNVLLEARQVELENLKAQVASKEEALVKMRAEAEVMSLQKDFLAKELVKATERVQRLSDLAASAAHPMPPTHAL